MIHQPDRLVPWCIVRLMPNAQTLIVARYRKCSTAEDALRLLHRLYPSVQYAVIFDVGKSEW